MQGLEEFRRFHAGFHLSRVHEEALAEGRGFEPPVPKGTHAFQASTIDHSDTPPRTKRIITQAGVF